MTNDSVLLKIKNSEFFNRIVTPKTICVFVGGSRMTDLADERSDYDLTVICEDESEFDVIKEYLMCDGKKIHWYYWKFGELFTLANIKSPILLAGLVRLYWLSEKTVLYVASDRKEQFDYILESKEAIASGGAHSLCHYYKNLICTIADSAVVEEKDYTKFLYHLCTASHVLREEPTISDHDKELLRKLKRIRWQPVSDEVKQYCVDRFKIIKEKMGW